MNIEIGAHNIALAMLQKYLYDNNINVTDSTSTDATDSEREISSLVATDMSVYYYQCYEMAETQLHKQKNS